MCTLVLQLEPGRRSFNHDGGGVDLSTKHNAVTVLTPQSTFFMFLAREIFMNWIID
jgi:hypothetical protein